MFGRLCTLFFALLTIVPLSAQELGFVANQGQWGEDFDYRLRTGQSLHYFRANAVATRLVKPASQAFVPPGLHRHGPYEEVIKGHVFELQWLGANAQASSRSSAYPGAAPLNFLLGSDPKKWRSQVGQSEELYYSEVYPGIDLRYYLTASGAYTFDFIVEPGADPSQIRWAIAGGDTCSIEEASLVIHNSVSPAVLSPPIAFQSGQRAVDAAFARAAEGYFFFQLGAYDQDDTLVIDPSLIFSTYSGGTDDNFGFTATFGADGSAYAGGISFGAFNRLGYPTSTGAFQERGVGGRIDIVISKYSADGKRQLYGTYLGGSQNEIPFSLIEGPDRSLYILGNTGSADFPVDSNALQNSFNQGNADTVNVGGFMSYVNGCDIFVSKLDSTGGVLLASTYVGGSESDGNNKRLEFNYGDPARGNMAIDDQGNVILVGSSFSPDFPHTEFSATTSHQGKQDGVVFSLSPDLRQLNWGSFFGGSDNDVVHGIAMAPGNKVYICGVTESTDLSYDTTGSYQNSPAGKTEAFIAQLDNSDGSLVHFSFTGTAEDDLAYFVDVDPSGRPVIFGQSFGNWPFIGDSIYGQPGSAQVLQLFRSDLSDVIYSAAIGTGQNNRTNISPTALMVSDCGDVFIAGWSGQFATPRGAMGRGFNMPVTASAYRDSTDGQDFYFLRLNRSWQKLDYATFFGQLGSNADHVDGGSSRFRKDGAIFHAVCAACGGRQNFPVSDSAFSTQNASNNCNMAVFRFDIEANEVIPQVSLAPSFPDTACFPYQFSFRDSSLFNDITLVRDPQGILDTLGAQNFSLPGPGRYAFQFYAIDTSCNLIDSTVVWVTALADSLQAAFTVDYDSCDGTGQIQLRNQSRAADRYQWLIADSIRSQAFEPSRQLPPGRHQLQLVVYNDFCGTSDTLRREIFISKRLDGASLQVRNDACDPEGWLRAQVFYQSYQLKRWRLNGELLPESGDSLSMRIEEGGDYRLSIELLDTLCQRSYTIERDFFFYDRNFEAEFPNIITPNGDGLNDYFQLIEPQRPDFFAESFLEIYDRRGLRLYRGKGIEARWDGRFGQSRMPDGVYYYLFYYRDICGQSRESRGFFHLQG